MAAVVVVDVVSQSQKESSCSTESAVCTATERWALQCCSSTEPFGGTERLSLENVFLATSFFGLARSDFCVSGRLSSELADFAAVVLAASWTERATCVCLSVCVSVCVSVCQSVCQCVSVCVSVVSLFKAPSPQSWLRDSPRTSIDSTHCGTQVSTDSRAVKTMFEA